MTSADRDALALYVECRIAFVDQPDVRLRASTAGHRGSVLVEAAGIYRSTYGALELDGASIELWRELLHAEGRRAAELAAEDFRLYVDRSYFERFTRGRIRV